MKLKYQLRLFKNIIFKNNFKKFDKKIIFIHIPKTSGTYLAKTFKNFKLDNKIIWNAHSIKVFQLNNTVDYIISIRNPYSRLMSAFYDVKRLYKKKLVKKKIFKKIFIKYETFNDLCIEIYDKNKKLNKDIENFFYSTHHIISGYSFFYHNIKPNIIKPKYIFEHERIEEDIKFFLNKNKIAYKKNYLKNKNIYENKYNKVLSVKSKKNLKRFFGPNEFNIYNFLKKNKQKINKKFTIDLK